MVYNCRCIFHECFLFLLAILGTFTYGILNNNAVVDCCPLFRQVVTNFHAVRVILVFYINPLWNCYRQLYSRNQTVSLSALWFEKLKRCRAGVRTSDLAWKSTNISIKLSLRYRHIYIYLNKINIFSMYNFECAKCGYNDNYGYSQC